MATRVRGRGGARGSRGIIRRRGTIRGSRGRRGRGRVGNKEEISPLSSSNNSAGNRDLGPIIDNTAYYKAVRTINSLINCLGDADKPIGRG